MPFLLLWFWPKYRLASLLSLSSRRPVIKQNQNPMPQIVLGMRLFLSPALSRLKGDPVGRANTFWSRWLRGGRGHHGSWHGCQFEMTRFPKSQLRDTCGISCLGAQEGCMEGAEQPKGRGHVGFAYSTPPLPLCGFNGTCQRCMTSQAYSQELD